MCKSFVRNHEGIAGERIGRVQEQLGTSRIEIGIGRTVKKLLVEYLGERYPVTVAVAGATPLFDPENERIRS